MLEEVKDGLEEAKTTLIKSHEKVVADWEHKPEFRARSRVSINEIAIDIYPSGEYKNIWRYVDEGTKPHTIKPKNSKILKFRPNYSPKTSPNPARYGGAGGSFGDWVFTKSVNHPGTEAREFTKVIIADTKSDIKRVIENALRRGSRRL